MFAECVLGGGGRLADWVVRVGWLADCTAGFGVLFDTFVNTEVHNAHKDVALLVNNDQKLADAFSTLAGGCDGDFRFWEGRDDFSITNRSAVKISYNVGAVLLSCVGQKRERLGQSSERCTVALGVMVVLAWVGLSCLCSEWQGEHRP